MLIPMSLAWGMTSDRTYLSWVLEKTARMKGAIPYMLSTFLS